MHEAYRKLRQKGRNHTALCTIHLGEVPNGGSVMMKFKTAAAAMTLAAVLAPMAVLAQQSHADAKAEQEAKDHRHHTKAKVVGGSAAGGAATGALVGGPVGAVVGAGVGAGGGLVANKIRKHHGIKKKEHEEQ